MRLGTLTALILCNLVWSAHPLMGKFLLLSFTPEQGAWLRYASALGAYLLVFGTAAFFPRAQAALGREPFLLPRDLRGALLVLALGLSAFCFSPLLQMTGLAVSRATDNSVIVALEPLMTVLMAWLLLRERPTAFHFAAFGFALFGFALLTGGGMPQVSGHTSPHFLGNFLMLSSLVGEALYSSIGRKLIVRHPPTAVFGSALIVGVVGLTCATFWLSILPSFNQIWGMSWKSALGLLWIGPFGTALAYLYWMYALKEAPVASIALTLFIQPFLGLLWGVLFLGERLTWVQGLGSGLILVAVFGQTWAEVRQPKTE